MSKTHLVEGFVAQPAKLYEVREAERAVLDHKAQQLGERLQETLDNRSEQEIY